MQKISTMRTRGRKIFKGLTRAPLEEIGREFGGMHHTTVLHSINKIRGILRSDKNLDCIIGRLVDGLRQS